MTGFDKKQNGDRTHMIATAIRNAILEQAIRPGTRLPEDTIGERFGVSRTIVRAALGELSAEGLVSQRRNRGAIVAEPSWTEARDTFDIRLALERIVAQRLVGRLSAEQLDIMHRHVDEEDKARDGDQPHSIRLAGEFHTLLADFTESEILSSYMRELTSRCCLILAHFSRPASSECAVTEHRALLEILATGTEAEAVEAMHQHMQAVVDRALISPPKREDREIGDILGAFAPDALD